MSKLVLWLRIARKYRPLFSLELQWLDLQILPEGSDPNADSHPLRPQEVKQQTIPVQISPVIPDWLKEGTVCVLTDEAKEKYIKSRFEPELIRGAWQVKTIQFGLAPRALVRSLVSNTKNMKSFLVEELRLLEPSDYQERKSN